MMNLLLSSFDIFIRFDRIIKESEEEIVLISPYLKVPEIIIHKLKEASRRGVRIILIHRDVSNNLNIFNEIENIQIFVVRSLHDRIIFSDKGLMFFSGDFTFATLENPLQQARYLDAKNEDFFKFTKEIKNLLTKAIMESPPREKPAPYVNHPETIGLMLKQMLENQKDELKEQIIAEMSIIISDVMVNMLSKIDEVEGEIKQNKEILLETKKVVVENYELTSQIRRELLSVLPNIQKTIIELKTDLYSRFEDLDVIYNELSDKITDDIHNIQVKIDKHNYNKAEQYLEGFLGDCWNHINLEARGFFITSEVIYQAMKDLPELDFSPTLIPMTKALENILNRNLFERVLNSLTPRDIVNTNKFKNIRVKNGKNAGNILEHATIGDIIYMFKDRDVLTVINRNRLFKQNIANDPYFSRDDRFINNKLNLTPQTLIGKLNLIRVKYRNKAAHQDGISKAAAEECRQYMIFGEAFIKEFLLKIEH